MIVVISSAEEMTPQELEVVEFIHGLSLDVRFHLRKPQWSEEQVVSWVEQVKQLTSMPKLAIHNHQLEGCSLHASERFRSEHLVNAISTSFHDEEIAIKEGHRYEYFFCSPVFDSISKPGYQANANWDVTAWPQDLKSKAVALGGVNESKLTATRNKGFEHIAICGAIWNTTQPVSALKNIIKTCQDQDLFV